MYLKEDSAQFDASVQRWKIAPKRETRIDQSSAFSLPWKKEGREISIISPFRRGIMGKSENVPLIAIDQSVRSLGR